MTGNYGRQRRHRLAIAALGVAALSMLFVLPSSSNAFQIGPGSFQRTVFKTSIESKRSRVVWEDVSLGGCRSRLFPLAAIALPDDIETPLTAVIPKEVIPKTLAEAIHTFLAGPFAGPRITLVMVLSAAAYRLTLPMTVLDPILFMGAIVYWWFQEHAMHKHLLHSRFDWYGKRIHEKHHQKNYFHISLDPAWLMIVWLLSVAVLLKSILPLPLALTTTIGYAAAGLFYEWSHYIVHTRVRFAKGSYWQRMKDHHIRHHLVNADNWLGFSLPQVDDLFGTNPDIKDFRRQQEAGR